MKKVLFLVLASFLALAACGNSEESKSEDKKETKSSSKDDKKKDENKKSNDDKKEKSDKEETSNADNNQQDDTEQQTQSVEQPQSTQEPVQSQEEVQPVEQQQQPTDQEKTEDNAKVAKENGYTGIPNGDAGLLEPSSDGYYSNDQLDPDTGLPMDDAVPHKNGEKESEWASAQDEWNNASESEKTEIRKADAKKYGYEYNPNDYK